MSGSILQYEERMWDLFEASKEQMPRLAEAYYGPVKQAVYGPGALDMKTKRLVSLAVAVQAGCKDCIISQTSKALELGATAAEIFETCAVAVSMGGTLAWSKVLWVADYLRERGRIGEQPGAPASAGPRNTPCRPKAPEDRPRRPSSP